MCPHSVHDDVSTGRTLGDVSVISFAAAGVGAIVGVVGLFLSGHKEDAATTAASVTPWIAPDIAGLRGSF
jgi:non-canonical (house-cleaning) NTP pyrophosphatase